MKVRHAEDDVTPVTSTNPTAKTGRLLFASVVGDERPRVCEQDWIRITFMICTLATFTFHYLCKYPTATIHKGVPFARFHFSFQMNKIVD